MGHVEEAALGTEQMPIRSALTPKEKLELKEELSAKLVALAAERKKLNAARALHKLEAKPLEKRAHEIVTILGEGSRTETKTCYLIPNYELNEMQYTLPDGEIVLSRKLKPEERQTQIFTMTGTNPETH